MENKIYNPDTGRLVKKNGRVHRKMLKDNRKMGGNKKQVDEKRMNDEKLPVFPNPDKKFHEYWSDSRDIMNVPHPFRCCLCGPPNCGKTSMILNLLMHNKPYFEEVIIIHCDPEYTEEYDNVGAIMTDEIPSPEQWSGDKKTLVILDDLEYKNLPKEQKKNLDRLFGFVSTHKNISVCLSAQDVFNIPTGVRRCSNLWVLWKLDDMDAITRLARRINYSGKEIKRMFDEQINTKHDSIMVDNTNASPYPLRKNGTIPFSLYD